MNSIMRDANAVLFPAFDGTKLSDSVKGFLDNGGVSILVGESREEYLARGMSKARMQSETADTFLTVTSEARARSGLLLAAVDQELAGICRLHNLVPQFPSANNLASTPLEQIEEISFRVAKAASSMGINVFLAPILDVLVGTNVWLNGRTWSTDVEKVAEVSAAFIRGVQRGGVAATAKHFPGFAETTGDPAINPEAISLASREVVESGLEPFKRAISAGVELVMVGPTSVAAIDPHRAALRSPQVVQKLKVEFGFKGVVMADDLDSKATMRHDSVEHVAIEALKAGCDFLLLADIGTQVADVAQAITKAVADGRLSPDKLANSASKLRALCSAYDTGR